jgi:hypothetical protein
MLINYEAFMSKAKPSKLKFTKEDIAKYYDEYDTGYDWKNPKEFKKLPATKGMKVVTIKVSKPVLEKLEAEAARLKIEVPTLVRLILVKSEGL